MISPQEIVDVREPPGAAVGKVAELAKPLDGGKVMCTACARYCRIGEGQVGLCGVRGVHGGKLWLYVYGKVITGHVDPIEKKPVTHYRPGSKIFSIATTGCNWLCHPVGTPILMADGTTRPVEELTPDDALWSVRDTTGRPVPGVVSAAGSRKAPVFRVSLEGRPEPLLGTGEHPVLTPRGWKTISQLGAADSVLVQSRLSPWAPVADMLRIPHHSPAAHPRETASYFKLAARRDLSAPEFMWSGVRGVSEESPHERVYSFECVPFHNYVASDVVVHNCRYCFLPGTMVLTERGHVPIETTFAEARTTDNPELRLVDNHQALTHRGRWRRISKSFEHLYAGTVLTIRPYYLPALECTPDHRVFASIAGGPVRQVRANRLRIGDFLAVPRPKRCPTSSIDAAALIMAGRTPHYKYAYRLELRDGRVRWSAERGPGLPATLTMTQGLARLLGYYCAEGSVSWHRKRPNSGSVWFSFGSHEETRIRETESLLHSELGLSTRRSRQRNRVAVVAPSSGLAIVLRELCGDSSASKRVPEAILRSTDTGVVRAFLTGYLRGDGYVTPIRSGGQILGSSSVSPAMTFGVAQLLFTLGDVPKVYRARNPSEYVIEGRAVSRSDDLMVRLHVDEVSLDGEEATWTASKVRVVRTSDYFLVPIRDIREREYVGPVYNIEVEKDHSYTANFTAVSNCQNYDISQRRKVEGIEVEPKDVVQMTLDQGCQGLAYTYNQPTIFIEFARDIGIEARKAGLMNIFVSNGYDTPEVVEQFPKFLDCITVDFKGSGETNFVRKYISIPNADPIFDTIQRTRDTKAVHIEITDLIVPQVGDDLEAARKLSKFVYDELGPETPIHFLRFHPDYKMMDLPWTPVETLEKHCAVAKEAGLKFVYIGNVPGHPLENTYCPGCGTLAVRRYGFDITGWYLDKDNRCKKCGYRLPITGRLEKTFKDDRFYSVLYHR